jgi:two-component system, NtrC family, response regulator AtoC
MKKILIIDDDQSLARTLDLYFRSKDYDVGVSFNAREGLDLWRTEEPDLVLLDVHLPGMDGTEVLARGKEEGLKGDVIMITAFQDMEATLSAIRRGAVDYLYKPLDLDALDVLLEKILVWRKSQDKLEKLSHVVSEIFKPNQIIGRSQAVLDVIKDIAKVSRAPVSVLIIGETGTGKELIARTIHEQAAPGEPFVAINCAAIVGNLLESELFGHEKGAFTGATQRKMGKLELAGNGTVFLDEIAELPLELQAKLLRVLQEKEFQRVGGLQNIPLKARVITATNRDLQAMAEKGQFREELYFRLKVFIIHIPPLRERPEDITPLVEYYITQLNQELHKKIERIPNRSLELMKSYDWPGNIRELQNVLKRAMILSDRNVLEIDECGIQRRECRIEAMEVPDQKTLGSLEEVEKDHILRVLRHTRGNYGEACKILGVSRPTLRKKISDYGLKEFLDV